MKTKEETRQVLAIGEQVCNIVRIAYPYFKDVAVEYENRGEMLIFSFDKKTYVVYVAGSSAQGVVIDIARQLLEKVLKNHS